jgi:hypothetical protein
LAEGSGRHAEPLKLSRTTDRSEPIPIREKLEPIMPDTPVVGEPGARTRRGYAGDLLSAARYMEDVAPEINDQTLFELSQLIDTLARDVDADPEDQSTPEERYRLATNVAFAWLLNQGRDLR